MRGEPAKDPASPHHLSKKAQLQLRKPPLLLEPGAEPLREPLPIPRNDWLVGYWCPGPDAGEVVGEVDRRDSRPHEVPVEQDDARPGAGRDSDVRAPRVAVEDGVTAPWRRTTEWDQRAAGAGEPPHPVRSAPGTRASLPGSCESFCSDGLPRARLSPERTPCIDAMDCSSQAQGSRSLRVPRSPRAARPASR